MVKLVLINPGRALDISAKVASVVASTSPKNVITTLPEMITFYMKGRSFTQAGLHNL